MRVLKVVLAILCGLWGLLNLIPLVLTFGVRAGWVRLPPELVQLPALAGALSWWQAAIWVVMILLHLMVAWRLGRGRSALGMFVLAFVIELVRWLPMQALPVYRQVFTQAELHERCAAFGVLVLIGLLIWWSERGVPSTLAVQ